MDATAGSCDGPRGFKKKRTKTIIKKAKHYGKKQGFGRGSDISEDKYYYLVHILEVCRDEIQTMDDPDVFVENVFDQFVGEEVYISSNQIGSRVVETLLLWANDKILERCKTAFFADLRPVCCDEYASHVLERLFSVITMRVLKSLNSSDKVEENEENRDKEMSSHCMTQMKAWIIDVSRFLINNLQEFAWDPYASHIICTMLATLSGQEHKFDVKRRKCESKDTAHTLQSTEEFHSLVEECAKRLIDWQLLGDMVYDHKGSKLLQNLLISLKLVNKKLVSKIIVRLLDTCFAPVTLKQEGDEKEKKELTLKSNLPEIFVDSPATNVLDVTISVASDKMFTQIYARCFKNRLRDLAIVPCGNFCVQTLFTHCRENTEFEAMFDELAPHFEAVLKSNNSGVLLALAQACERLSTRQSACVKHLMIALHCLEPSERQTSFVPVVSQLVSYETWQANCADAATGLERKMLPTLHGSLLLQTILKFNKPIKVVNSLLAMEISDLQAFTCNTFGSHVIDALFKSKYVGDKNRVKFVQKMKGKFVALAVNTRGSWALQAMLDWAPPKLQTTILEELAPSEHAIEEFQCGKIISLKYSLSLFKRRPQDWLEVQNHEQRKRTLFADIIGTDK